ANVDPGAGRHGPGEAPAIAVEHGQGPQVHAVLGHVPLQHVADGVDGRTAVVVDHTLGVAGGAAGVVEGNRIPLVLGQLPGECRIPLGDEVVVTYSAHLHSGFPIQLIVHLDNELRFCARAQLQCLGNEG